MWRCSPGEERVGKRHAACLREGRRRGKKEGHRPVNLAEWLLPRHVGKDEVGKEARKREGIKGGEKKGTREERKRKRSPICTESVGSL